MAEEFPMSEQAPGIKLISKKITKPKKRTCIKSTPASSCSFIQPEFPQSFGEFSQEATTQARLHFAENQVTAQNPATIICLPNQEATKWSTDPTIPTRTTTDCQIHHYVTEPQRSPRSPSKVQTANKKTATTLM